MNKKGVIWEDLADLLLGGSILFITITSYLLIIGLHQEKINSDFQEKTQDITQDEIFISYLHADLGKNIFLEDLITFTRINNKDKISENFDPFLEKIYSEKVCWILYFDDKEWIKKNNCKIKETLLDGKAITSFPDKTTHKLELKINGYADG